MSNLKTMLFICFVIAVVFFAAAIAFAFESRKKKWKEITPFRILFGGSFLTVFTLMLPAAYYSFITENPCWFFRGLMRFLFALHNTLQTFTIDVGAKDVIENLTAAYSDNSWLTLYRAFLMVFMLISPVFTATFLLSFFQKVRVWFELVIHPFRSRYVFSELNDATYSVAKNIFDQVKKDREDKEKERKDKLSKPLIIFTDVYSDSSNESQSELVEKAKSLGAFCLKDDVLSMQMAFKWNYPTVYNMCRWVYKKLHSEKISNWYQRIKEDTKVYLMLADYDDYSNVQTLCALSEEKNLDNARKTFGRNIHVHVFFGDDSYNHAYKSARELIYINEEKNGKSSFQEINRNNWKQDVIHQLLQKTPLFEGVLDKTVRGKPVKLSVSVIGAGKFGTEMFLNSYWCGQMIGVDLHLNVLSLKETKEEFIKRINRISPEIIESTQIYSELLRITPEDKEAHYSAPYFKFGYFTGDVFEHKPDEIVFDNGNKLLESDYIFVSLGKDESSIDFAQSIQRELCIERFPRKPIIVCVVNNNDVYKSLQTYKHLQNEIAKENSKEDENSNVRYLGITEYAYSYETVFKEDLKKADGKTRELYKKMNSRHGNKREDDEYEFNSSRARALHKKYRVFSAFNVAYNVDKYKDEHYPLKEDKSPDFENAEITYNNIISDEANGHAFFEWKRKKEKINAEIEKKFAKKDTMSKHSKLFAELEECSMFFEELKKLPDYEKTANEIIEKGTKGNANVRDVIKKIISEISNYNWGQIFKDEKEKGSLHAELRWLEKRRWNANIRSTGFAFKYNNGKKDLKLKTHNCLIECNNDAEKSYEDRLEASFKVYDDPFDYDYKETESNKAK